MARPAVNPHFRFWSKVVKTAECWLWIGSRSDGAYGQFRLPGGVGSKLVQAHRYAYESLVGAIPDGLTLDHLCENKGCVNPAHLEAVSLAENIRRSKGRKRDECPKGHVYTPATTAFSTGGSRICLICDQPRLEARRRVLETSGSPYIQVSNGIQI